MPSKRKQRKTKKSANRLTLHQGVPSGIAVQQVVRLRYAEHVNMISTTGSLAVQNFSANNPYDPNTTGTGHQPMGWDQWTALYNHYVVLRSTLKGYIIQDANTQGIVGCMLSDDTSHPYTTGVDFIEAGKGTFKNLSMTRGAVKIYSRYDAKKFFNVADVKDNLDRLGGSVAGGPADEAQYMIYFNTLDSNTDTIRLIAVIEYDILFSEPKALAQS